MSVSFAYPMNLNGQGMTKHSTDSGQSNRTTEELEALLKERDATIAGIVSKLHAEDDRKDQEIEALRAGLKENIEMLQMLEKMEKKSGKKTRKQISELQQQLEDKTRHNAELADSLALAEAKIKDLESQVEASEQKITDLEAQAFVGPSGQRHDHSDDGKSYAAFVREMELVAETIRNSVNNLKQKQTTNGADSLSVPVVVSPVAVEATHARPRRSTSLSMAISKGMPSDDTTMSNAIMPHRSSGTRKFRRMTQKIIIVNTALAKMKFVSWSKGLRRMDPRFQILNFFNDVASKGADALEGCEVERTGVCVKDCFDQDTIVQVKKRSSLTHTDAQRANTIFNKAGVFTVWRPTSLEAIRKMMTGEGVGKGLDIKGKSSKRGHLSGFVPYLQLHEDKHKGMVRSIPADARMKVFFSTKEACDIAYMKMLAVCVEMLSTYSKAQKVLEKLKLEEIYNEIENFEASELLREEALSKWMWHMEDPTIHIIDEYAPESYGLDVPQRLFFEVYVMRGDCRREAGGFHDTGRMSEPAFQDMNNETLRKREHKPGAPRPVVLQYATDANKVMDPRYLLMAYEECGRVRPVVSDFDCFVVGTRRIYFDEPLPPDQVELMKWCISQIETILSYPPSTETWTMRWLEELKVARAKGFHPHLPTYGFADPKSYSIMAHAVSRLSTLGSVRHGAECFNYYFPQDLDDEFLVVTNNQDNGPWNTYTRQGLLDFLSKKIDEGFMFPVNPKWILCDPGWSHLYFKQMESLNPTAQKAMDAWYPRESGVRDMLKRISDQYPNCFQVVDKTYVMEQRKYSPLRDAAEKREKLSGDTTMDLAMLEIQHDQVLQKAIKSFHACLFAIRLDKKRKAKQRATEEMRQQLLEEAQELRRQRVAANKNRREANGISQRT